jgi:hypothetical protein
VEKFTDFADAAPDSVVTIFPLDWGTTRPRKAGAVKPIFCRLVNLRSTYHV